MIGDKLSKQDELTEMSERRNAPRTCLSCNHCTVCKAYETVMIAFTQINKQNDKFLKLPMKAEDIAIGCSQYQVIIPTKPEFGR